MKTFALVLVACMAWASGCPAGQTNDPAVGAALIQVDWQEPQLLPPRYRNHCAYDRFSGRPYCSDHCGFEYQFYFCSRQSSGCCRTGFGYCDWNGLLRCHP
jgi:hypothetical protein